MAVAADSDDHVVTQLLTAAGRALSYTDDDSADDYPAESGCDRFDRFDIESAHGQHARELPSRYFRVDEGAQPAFWEFHVNWARKRKSPS